MKETKATSIRMDQETKDKLQMACEKLKSNQGDALKEILTNFLDSQHFAGDDQKDLEDALYHVTALTDVFRSLVKSRSEAFDKAELTVKSQIRARDDLIKRLKAENEEFRLKIRDLNQDITRLLMTETEKTAAERQLGDLKCALDDSRALNATLTEQLAVFEAEKEGYTTAESKIKSLERKLEENEQTNIRNLLEKEQEWSLKIESVREKVRNQEKEYWIEELNRLKEEIAELRAG